VKYPTVPNQNRTQNGKIPSRIQTIFFDLDGTLRHNRPDAHHFFFDHAARLGVPDSTEKRRQAYRWAHAYWSNSPRLQADELTHGRDTLAFWSNYAARYLRAFGSPDDQAADLAPAMQAHMAENYQPENWVPEEVHETLVTLRKAGIPMAVVSNRTLPYHEELTALELDLYFNFAVAAGEVGSWKPDTGIFQHALKIAGATPATTIYVGDNYYADAIGALKAGLHPVLIDPERLFPEATCLVLERLDGLLDILSI